MRYLLSIPAGVLVAAVAYVAWLAGSAGVPSTLDAAVIAAWYDRKIAIAESLASPRILIAGGSSSLYGIRASLIEERTGIPAVNLGTHAALSLDYHLHRIRKVARPGDIVVLALEYELYTNRPANSVFSDFVIGGDPAYLAKLPASELASWAVSASADVLSRPLFDLLPGRKAGRSQRADESASQLDNRGDFVRNDPTSQEDHHRRIVDQSPGVAGVLRPKLLLREPTWARLADFASWCRERDITLLATFPATIRTPAHDARPATRAMSALLEAFADLGVPTLGTPAGLLRPREDFFDTVYHLNSRAAAERTGQLLDDLAPHLDRRDDPPSPR